MNAVPSDKRGQAGGISRGIQQIGGTIGMAVCGTLLAMTGDFQLVFYVTAGVIFVALIIGWFSIDFRPDASARLGCHSLRRPDGRNEALIYLYNCIIIQI